MEIARSDMVGVSLVLEQGHTSPFKSGKLPHATGIIPTGGLFSPSFQQNQ